MASEPAAPPPRARGSPGRSPYTPIPYRVIENRAETHDTVTLLLSPADGTRPPPYLPGQFNMLYSFGIGEVAISISGDPSWGSLLVHTVRAVGKASTALTRTRPGDTVGVRGPYGRGWPLEEARGKDVVVVAGGLGLPPLRPLILEILRHRELYGRVEIIYGARTPSDLVYYDELQAWRQGQGFRLQVTVDAADRNWYGDVGVVTRRLPDARFEPSRTTAFLCGPEIMMKRMAEALVAQGVPEPSVWLSMERNMKCAIGQCGHCQYGPLFICREGPVLSYARIRPLLAQREV